MKLQIKDILGKHKNKPCFIMGLGPSLNPHLDKLKEYRSKYIMMSCNQWYKLTDVNMHYWMLSNNVNTIKNLHEVINSRGVPVFYAESVDQTPREEAEKLLKVDYLQFDERHFTDRPLHKDLCKVYDCCARRIPGRLTIQEEVQKFTGYSERNTAVYTVIEHCISFAILMLCNPIYVVGVELDYAYGYAGNNILEIPNVPGWKGFVPHRHIIVENFKILNEHAKRKGLKILNISKNPTFDAFEYGTL